MNHRFNPQTSTICYRKETPTGPKSAPINQLKQYPVSNYHYEKYICILASAAPRGVRAKD
jgi:hypothetical protein